MTAIDLGSVRRRADRLLADGHSSDDVAWLLREGRNLARQATVLADEVGVLRELVDGLESELKIVDADRMSAVEAADRRLREMSGLRVALMAVELYARKARA